MKTRRPPRYFVVVRSGPKGQLRREYEFTGPQARENALTELRRLQDKHGRAAGVSVWRQNYGYKRRTCIAN